MFRGYLQQQLAARFRSPLAWMLVPSILFGALHYSPEAYGDNAWIIVAWSVMFGLLAADLTARTGNLGAAIGFHFANNFSAILLVGLAGQMDGLALWTLAADPTDGAAMLPLLIIDAAWLWVSWLLARLMLRV